MIIYVWGTGFAAKELLENELSGIEITGFIDNNSNKIGGVEHLYINQILL